jgi:hypothetical protein
MSKSKSSNYQRGGLNFPDCITRTLPVGNLPSDREDAFHSARATWIAARKVRELAITDEHAFAEVLPAFVKGMALLRRALKLEKFPTDTTDEWQPAVGVTCDVGSGTGAFLFLNAAATGQPTIGVEKDWAVHQVQIRVHMASMQLLGLPVSTRFGSGEDLFDGKSTGIRNVFMFDGASETSLDPIREDHLRLIREMMLDSGIWSIMSTKLNTSLMSRYAEKDEDIARLLDQFQCYRVTGKKVNRQVNLRPWLWVRHVSARTSLPAEGRVLALAETAWANDAGSSSFGTSPPITTIMFLILPPAFPSFPFFHPQA